MPTLGRFPSVKTPNFSYRPWTIILRRTEILLSTHKFIKTVICAYPMIKLMPLKFFFGWKNQNGQNIEFFICAPTFYIFSGALEYSRSAPNTSWAFSVSCKRPQYTTDASKTSINCVFSIYGQKYTKNTIFSTIADFRTCSNLVFCKYLEK